MCQFVSTHLESYPPGQDMAKWYVRVWTWYRHVHVYTSLWIHERVCTCYVHVHDVMHLNVHSTYTFMNNIFLCTWYIHVHECKYMYGHSTDTSVQLHNHTSESLSIRPDQLCDARESQLRAGSAPSEQRPSCHQSSCTYVEHTLFITAHPCMYIVHTCLYMVQTCSSFWMSVHGSSWFILVHPFLL
jgi:hypothetical protein